MTTTNSIWLEDVIVDELDVVHEEGGGVYIEGEGREEADVAAVFINVADC